MPETQTFEGLTAVWAESVATNSDAFAGDGQPLVDDLWVSTDLVLHVRYRIGADLLGGRFHLDLDPTSQAAPTDSATLASLLLHNLHATGEPEWADCDGYVWWGERPARGWTAVADDERLITLR